MESCLSSLERSGSHACDALYQGTTSTARRDRLVGPHTARLMRALAPEVLLSRPTQTQGLKPSSGALQRPG
jgi:hypothetical protein